MVAYSKPSYRNITFFLFNYADFPPLSSKSSVVNSCNSPQSLKLSSNSNFWTFTQKSFAESVLKSNHSLFPFVTTTRNSYFSPSARKSSVASAQIKFFPSFSCNSDNSLVSRATAICEANCSPKSNLVLKDHSKSHILPVSVKHTIPMFLIFVFLPYFPILVMLWFKIPVLFLTHLSLFLSQIKLHNVLFLTQNSQALRFLLLLNLPSQFLQQIAIIAISR